VPHPRQTNGQTTLFADLEKLTNSKKFSGISRHPSASRSLHGGTAFCRDRGGVLPAGHDIGQKEILHPSNGAFRNSLQRRIHPGIEVALHPHTIL
jgi:hypothetical protein